MKKQKSTIGKWTMKTKSGKWFTQVGLKIQGVKASEEWKLIPIIGFGQTNEDSTYNIVKINQDKAFKYLTEGNNTEAIKYYTKAIENTQFLPPLLFQLHIYRAIAKARLGEINSAFDDINYCIDILPMGQLFFTRGYLFWGYTENYDSAISDFLRAIEYDNKNGEYFWFAQTSNIKVKDWSSVNGNPSNLSSLLLKDIRNSVSLRGPASPINV